MSSKNELAKIEVLPDTVTLLKSIGISPEDAAGFEQTQTGGVSRWLNLKAFQKDPNAPQNKPVQSTGMAFAGILLGRQEIEVQDDEAGEVNADGVKVRHFYTFKLLTKCPITFKNEDGGTQEAIALPGDIISVGERHQLRKLRDLTDNGGLYAIVIRPHSRIKIGGAQTMWTFDTWEKILRQPMKVRAEIVQKTAPF